ncbi:MAG: hypothetical protein MJ239_05240, partial [Bacilli bacterium]|nr:hypothetical protein [Bacilli bacterium]
DREFVVDVDFVLFHVFASWPLGRKKRTSALLPMFVTSGGVTRSIFFLQTQALVQGGEII